MTGDFTYEANPMRVRFGSGSLQSVADELDHLGLRRVLVLCSPSQQSVADRVASILGDRCVGIRSDAVMHVPADLAARASAEAIELIGKGAPQFK